MWWPVMGYFCSSACKYHFSAIIYWEDCHLVGILLMFLSAKSWLQICGLISSILLLYAGLTMPLLCCLGFHNFKVYFEVGYSDIPTFAALFQSYFRWLLEPFYYWAYIQRNEVTSIFVAELLTIAKMSNQPRYL